MSAILILLRNSGIHVQGLYVLGNRSIHIHAEPEQLSIILNWSVIYIGHYKRRKSKRLQQTH